MRIKRLYLRNFRNYSEDSIDFAYNTSLIYGDNAQGKTNIIEALFMISTGKSHRTNNLNELVKHGENYFRILLDFEDNGYDQNIEIKYVKGKRKELFINGVKKDRISDMLGVVPSVLFSPESILYIKGSPGERRRIMDIVLCQVNKDYLINLQRYNRIIKNKNIVLKQLQVGRNEKEQLDIWDEEAALTGFKIIKERHILAEELENRMNEIMEGISEGRERIKIQYKTFKEIDKIQNGYKDLLETITNNREKEIETGISMYGPHRDDMEILLNGKSARTYCSQGQQRSIALSLCVAVMGLMEEKLGKKTLLLFDDVMSELDEKRQKFLLELIGNSQTVITTTEKTKYNALLNNISFIKVCSGKIIKEKE
ncbi:MAG: DNA replication/repair protein RecF [Clostridiaceae bacterium]|nr:DNA replication/repair protein RecF [Clostridiaceae bacterium]